MKKFVVIRDYFAKSEGDKQGFTLGEIYLDGVRIGYTLEDEDRHLELDGKKVYGKTCIPRGNYRVVVDFSYRFQKPLPHILDVPQFTGIRIHGGNTAEDVLGCIAVGQIRTANGVAKCAPVVQRIIDLIQQAEDKGDSCFIEIK